MYDELFEAWRREKENAEVQPLPKDFYVRVTEYVKKIREERRMLDEKTVRGRLLRKEEENVSNMITGLIQSRHEKVTRMVTNEQIVPTASLTEEEYGLYREASSQTDSYKTFLKNVLQGKLPKELRERPKGFMIVRILQEIPQIVGADMKTYGPFKPEDIATLPEENAKVLIKQGAAAEIETQ